jgi:cytochrome P450
VINSPDLASDILHKKGAIYSDRSTPHFLVYLVGWKDTTIFLEDGPQLREHRRMIAQTLGTKAALKRFVPAAQIHTKNFLRQLRDDPHPERMMINTYIRW